MFDFLVHWHKNHAANTQHWNLGSWELMTEIMDHGFGQGLEIHVLLTEYNVIWDMLHPHVWTSFEHYLAHTYTVFIPLSLSIYACPYVCIYIYAHVHICIYVCMDRWMYVWMYRCTDDIWTYTNIHTYTYIVLYPYMQIFIHIYIYVCILYIYTYIYIYTCRHTYTYTYTYTYIYIYIYVRKKKYIYVNMYI